MDAAAPTLTISRGRARRTIRRDASRLRVGAIADAVRVTIEGELDLLLSDEFETAVQHAREERPGRVVVDLRAVIFLDASGLRALLALRNTARREGWAFELVEGPPNVDRIFSLTATRSLFVWQAA
jgi:anti-sigma B factor antagonist